MNIPPCLYMYPAIKSATSYYNKAINEKEIINITLLFKDTLDIRLNNLKLVRPITIIKNSVTAQLEI